MSIIISMYMYFCIQIKHTHCAEGLALQCLSFCQQRCTLLQHRKAHAVKILERAVMAYVPILGARQLITARAALYRRVVSLLRWFRICSLTGGPLASVPGLPRSHMRIYLSACGTRTVAQERGRTGLKYHVRVGSGYITGVYY